ncbi:MAG: Gfo/Idh/MocA family oxidoreductase [Acidobacteria bacterium]|nr:Gfo/Idh/MocA family oxidoreductase [Acidobacteriota bacterium]
MHRREFLSAALAAQATLRAAERIRIGVLGATHPHAAEKIRVLRESQNLDLAGVCEPDPAVRAALEKKGVRLVERDALLGDASIRIVAVESGVRDHAAHARLALEAGKHVHVEKPPSAQMRDLQELVALARRKNLLMQMGYMWRYHPGFNAILEAARKGWLGEIYLVRGIINTLLPAADRASLAQFAGGQMFEMGGHLIDALVRLMGPPRRVTPFLHSADNTAAVFDYPRAMAVVSSATLQPNSFPHRSFEVFGTSGTAVLRPLEPGTLVVDLARAAGPYAVGMQTVKLAPFRRYVADFEDLAEAVRASRPLAITPQEDLNVHEALLRASGMWSRS